MENLMSKDHKAVSKKYRDNYDNIDWGKTPKEEPEQNNSEWSDLIDLSNRMKSQKGKIK